MNKFEKYIPGHSKNTKPLENVTVRQAVISDSPVLAMIRFNREGGDLTILTANFENEIKKASPNAIIFW